MAERDIAGRDEYLRRMSPVELQALIELVVVPESWMFRDAQAFVAATDFLRARLAARPARTLRVLSLPCAGGEEPYSLAMALADAGVAPGACRIDAVDLSKVALARARDGLYTRNAFRGDDLAFRERHFVAEGADYRIDAALRARINFAEGNLLTIDSVANARCYDVIFCRNLLIYFDEATVAAAIAKLGALLADDGLLFAGYAEVPAFCRHGFEALRQPGAFALHKLGVDGPAPARAQPPRKARPVRPPAARPAPLAPPLAPPAAAPRPDLRPPASPAAPAPQDVRAMLADARTQADQGAFAAAAATCQAVLAGAPDTAEAYFILALVSEFTHDQAAAEGHLRRCVYLQPDHYDALCHLSLRVAQDGNPDEAATLRQRAARVYERRHAGRGVGA
ncbi:methyltransferase [Massilia glaciei]|uniref:Methyltransferase n=2 Tax=Massilia glaciei TaxID=1524097 RepID=A0A2U2HF10_9BURK|nr:methyltransferase [Massilia glaciei]